MNRTKIETAEYTWNPVTGCDQVCFNGDCYAYQMVHRFGKSWGYDWTPRFHADRLMEPFNEKRPRLIFAPSVGDLMTPSLLRHAVWAVLDIMGICDWHRFMVQTKYAKRLPEFNYPTNIWLGVSLCYQCDVERLDYLRETDARIKYAYCEPLLEDLEPDFTGIDWVVIGAKTGAHPFQPDFAWVRKLTLMAGEAGAKVFHKSNLKCLLPGGIPPPIRQFPDQEWFTWRSTQSKGGMVP